MPRLQTPHLQMGVFQTVVTVAYGHNLVSKQEFSKRDFKLSLDLASFKKGQKYFKFYLKIGRFHTKTPKTLQDYVDFEDI